MQQAATSPTVGDAAAGEVQQRQILAKNRRDLFKLHPDRQWLYQAGSKWNVYAVADLDNWKWWESTDKSPFPVIAVADVSDDLLQIMQQYEAALRLSTATQDLLSMVYHGSTVAGMRSHEAVIGGLQEHVVAALGVVDGGLDAGVSLLRGAQTKLQQVRNNADITVNQGAFVPHYVRYNRLQQPQVAVGELLCDTPLHTLDGQPTKLLQTLHKLSTSAPGTLQNPVPVVVVASSLT